MTMQDMYKYYDLADRLKRDREIIDSLRSKATPASPALTGMPHGNDVGDKVGYLATEIAYMESKVAALKAEAEQERKELENYIDAIDNEKVCIICRLRFIRLLPWDDVAQAMGVYYTGSGCRKCVANYLREHT